MPHVRAQTVDLVPKSCDRALAQNVVGNRGVEPAEEAADGSSRKRIPESEGVAAEASVEGAREVWDRNAVVELGKGVWQPFQHFVAGREEELAIAVEDLFEVAELIEAKSILV